MHKLNRERLFSNDCKDSRHSNSSALDNRDCFAIRDSAVKDWFLDENLLTLRLAPTRQFFYTHSEYINVNACKSKSWDGVAVPLASDYIKTILNISESLRSLVGYNRKIIQIIFLIEKFRLSSPSSTQWSTAALVTL